jgi:hypothetical protein
MSNAFIYRMPGGIPGDVTRREHATIVPEIMDANHPVLKFGLPVKIVSGKIRPMAANDSGQPYGFLVRPYPSQMATSEALAEATPDPTKICDVLKRGYMTVVVLEGTPAKDGQVYYRSQAGSPAENVGGLETDSSGSPTTNIAITGCKFVGTADADKNVEIAYNI